MVGVTSEKKNLLTKSNLKNEWIKNVNYFINKMVLIRDAKNS